MILALVCLFHSVIFKFSKFLIFNLNSIMKTDKTKSACSKVVACALSGLAGLALLAPLAQTANAEVTPPVGYVKLTFNAESDTPFSLPLNRPKVYSGQVATISGNTINLASNDLTASELVYNDGTQNEKYYVLFTTGLLEGRTFDVTANGANSITVDQDGDTDVETLAGAATDNFEIRPHWTLNTLFPDGAGFNASNDFDNPNGDIIFERDNTLNGLNLSMKADYFYYDNGDAFTGWYNKKNGSKVNDMVIKSGSMLIYRNTTLTNVITNLVGDVPLTDNKAVVVRSNVIDQDRYVGTIFPIGVTLNEAGFQNSSLYTKSTDFDNPEGDLIFVYPDNPTGFNPAPSGIYFYYDNGDAFTGWYDKQSAGLKNDVEVFKPGKGFFYRKAANLAESELHNSVLPYNPFAE